MQSMLEQYFNLFLNETNCVYESIVVYYHWKKLLGTIVYFYLFFQWEVKAPMPSQCFRAICKQISKMHEAVIDILPLNQIQVIYLYLNMYINMCIYKAIKLHRQFSIMCIFL